MSYRDDNDAAFERADALQHDVDQQQATIAALRKRLDASETERARLAELTHEIVALEPQVVAVAEEKSWSAEATMTFFALAIVALFAIVMFAARH